MNKATYKIEGRLTIKDCAMASDGGSKYIGAVDSAGNKVNFLLPQYVMPENFDKKFIPGRLHINGKPIEVRSQDEKEILSKLEDAQIESKTKQDREKNTSFKGMVCGQDLRDYFAAIQKGPEYATAYLIKEVLDFVKSDEYLKTAEKFKKR